MSASTNANSSANEEKLTASKLEKDKGNEFFKSGNISEALRHYHQALLHLHGLQNNKSFAIFRKEQEEEPKTDPLQEDIMKTTSVIYSNMSACLIKKEKWSRAIECADKALKNDPDNTKALFRRAQAYISDGNTTRARQDLEKLTEKNPDDQSIKREWLRLKQKDKEQDQKQRRELAGMFDRMKKLDEKEETGKVKNKAANESTNEPKISEIIDDPPKISEVVEDEAKISEIE
ncbi:2830_t:CDS:2 [Cetraspora pellucida]|uniref:2830_t:CDS:1 n=1 Tax=Cetraspora pellucida TaxID=1433469 RepID=A0A9N9DL65_9GLOM|nr:2830_t:CDS:2 [Cetraspora pellucida]